MAYFFKVVSASDGKLVIRRMKKRFPWILRYFETLKNVKNQNQAVNVYNY